MNKAQKITISIRFDDHGAVGAFMFLLSNDRGLFGGHSLSLYEPFRNSLHRSSSSHFIQFKNKEMRDT